MLPGSSYLEAPPSLETTTTTTYFVAWSVAQIEYFYRIISMYHLLYFKKSK
jgi:hypothetical protein